MEPILCDADVEAVVAMVAGFLALIEEDVQRLRERAVDRDVEHGADDAHDGADDAHSQQGVYTQQGMHPRAVSATDTRVTIGPNNGGAVDRHVGWRLKTGDFLGAKKSREQLLRLRSTARRHYTSANSDGIVQFYERQNGLLETFEEVRTGQR